MKGGNGLKVKKIEEKPMVIRTKKSSQIHQKKETSIRTMGQRKSKGMEDQEVQASFRHGQKKSTKTKNKDTNTSSGHGNNRETSKTQGQKEKQTKQSEKMSAVSAVTAVSAKIASEQVDGGDEIYDACMVMQTVSVPFRSFSDKGKQSYREKSKRRKEEQIKKAKEKTFQKESRVKSRTAKEPEKPTGRKQSDNFARNRMLQYFASKMQKEENQDSLGKTMKDIVLMRLSVIAKKMMGYAGAMLLPLMGLIALSALPVAAVITLIYNSPFAIFFPSISSAETTQEVLSAYVEEFQEEIEKELREHPGYDASEKIYLNFEGTEEPDNYFDILAVYMVKHGNGDTATDMTDRAKENLKSVFDGMCSYSISDRTETETDEEGETITVKIKEVNVRLRTYLEMISRYGFDEDEQEILAELMKPENLALLGYAGSGSSPGETISREQYQAIVDSISDANGRAVVEFVLSRVGYPYSQEYRDSGEYYDCSSLAYYAWLSAGVNLMYEGANTAAAEGKFCYDHNYLVTYDEMLPGDLIFFSYSHNGRFMDITHVAVYVGGGKVVEAANTSLGVVYRKIPGRNNIVMIGRPR